MSNYVCNECTSEDIEIIKGTNEMDCYCNNCKQKTYTVSLWWAEPQAVDDYYMSLMEKS